MIDTAKSIRKKNLEYLLDKYEGTKTSFAEKCGVSQAAFSHITGVNPYRNIGDTLARKIESNLGLKLGYLDIPQYKESEENDNLISVTNSVFFNSSGIAEDSAPENGKIKFVSIKNEFAILVKNEGLYPRINGFEHIVLSFEEAKAGDEVYLLTKSGEIIFRKITELTDKYYKLSTINPSMLPPMTIEKNNILNIYKLSAIVK